MELSKKDNTILLIVEKGYYINEEGKIFNNKNKELKGYVDKRGYKKFNIRINSSETIALTFHRFQGYFKFKNQIFNKSLEIRHLNSNKLDNSFDNIGIGTHTENMNDIPKKQRIEKALLASSFIKVYDHEEVFKYYNEVNSYKLTMEKFNISSKGTLHWILNKFK